VSTASSTGLPTRPPLVLGDALPNAFAKAWARDAVLVATGALLTALCAQIVIPMTPVPMTGQTFAVVLAGATLGARRGAASQLLYLIMGLFLPVYAEGGSGTDVIWGASGGYIVGFVIAAYLIGTLAERGADRKFVLAFATFIVGQLVIFGIGVPWLKVSADLSWATAIHDGFTVFIIGGLVKAAAVGMLTPAAWRGVKKLDARD